MPNKRLIVISALALGCAKEPPKLTVDAGGSVATRPSAESRIPAVVGDPSMEPGEQGAPCKDETCGHDDCERAREFVTVNKCMVCAEPVGWGRSALTIGDDRKLHSVAPTPIAMLFHVDCANAAQCDVCKQRLGISRLFTIVNGKPVHEACLEKQ